MLPSDGDRRGGYGDGGGLTLDNRLPLAEPVAVGCDADLKTELESIRQRLGSTSDWVERIQALVRLEGLVRGDALHLPFLLEGLKQLRDPLVAQLSDRRSAVSRQACHVVAVLAAQLGNKFEAFAIFFIPVITKVLMITVQVMADAANECLHSILHSCRSGKLLPKIADFILTDKSAKIRHHCVKYLLQVYDSWKPESYERYVEFTFPAVKASLQDASSETRTVGRMAVAALCHAFPEKGKAFIKALDGSLRQRLPQLTAPYKPGPHKADQQRGMHVSSGSFEFPHINTSAQIPRTEKTDGKGDVEMQASLADDAAKVERGGKYGRIDVAGASCRLEEESMYQTPCKVPKQPAEQQTLLGSESVRMGIPAAPAVRFHMGSFSVGAQSSKKKTKRRALTPERVPVLSKSVSKGDREKTVQFRFSVGPARREVRKPEDATRPSPILEEKPKSFSALLSQAAGGCHDWRAKEGLLNEIAELVEGEKVPVSDFMNSVGAVTNILCSFIEDPHHKVVAGALRLAGDCFQKQHVFMEGSFSRLAPHLFARATDQRDQIRSHAAEILQSCGLCFSGDVIFGACLDSLNCLRIPRALPEIFRYFTCCTTEGPSRRLPSQGHLIRRGICALLTFAEDKTPAIRQAAGDALEHLIHAFPRDALRQCLIEADIQEQHLLNRGLRSKFADLLPDPAPSPAPRSPRQSRPPGKQTPMTAEKRTVTPRKRRSEMCANVNQWLLEALSSCKSLSEVEKLTRMTTCTDRISRLEASQTDPLHPKTLKACLELLISSRSAVREQTVILLNELIKKLRCDLSQTDIQEILNCVLSVLTDTSDLVTLAVEVFLETLLKSVSNPTAHAACLSCVTTSEASPLFEADAAFVAFLKLFARLTRSLSSEEVALGMQQTEFGLVKILLRRWQSDRVEVRKSVVGCLAQIGSKIGSRLDPHLAGLSESQRKLLQLYIAKCNT